MAGVTKNPVDRYAATFGNRMWRLHNLYWITNDKGQEIKFVPNAEQADFLENRWDFNCILKARQLGFSTVIQIDGLDDCVFNSNIEFGVIAQGLDEAKAIFRSKIKFAYDRLPDEIRNAVKATTDTANEIRFSNGSGVRVGTSMRGGTLQRLHISEFGKIAAKYPDKAREIKTGALNTVHAGQLIDVESTAEGRGGEFFELCQRAEKLKQSDTKLTSLDPRFHFYPWWMKREYRLAKDGVSIPQELKTYFQRLEEDHGIELDDEQRAWYVKKSEQMGDDMKQEFPSTSAEPFEVAVDGAYYAREMARVRKDGRICRLPIETDEPINTFWDLGRNDLNAIWMHQQVGREQRFIGFYQNGGESIGHYVRYLKDWLPEGCSWGTHYLPHDANVKEYGQLENKTREEVIQDLGLRDTVIVPRIAVLGEAIQMVRDSFSSCYFDQEKTSEGIVCLDNYQREWNETHGVWRDQPKKTQWNHGADAFRQFAQGYSRSEWGSFEDEAELEDDWVL